MSSKHPESSDKTRPDVGPGRQSHERISEVDSGVRITSPEQAAFGRYELIAEIARGGMARVCLCRRAGEAGFHRLFALKVMHDHLADEAEFVEMLLDEAHMAARVHHPNVVSIVDLGRSASGGYYLVMDYVEGCSLSQLLAKSRAARPPRLVMPILLDALSGLHAAHSLRDDEGVPLHIVHRDVSPQNVLVGVDGSARIADFGIAKARARMTATRPGVLKGKLEYMTPEQIAGRELDARSDLFSMGVVMWNSLTGERLFRGKTDVETFNKVLRSEIPRPSTVGLEPPAVLDDLVMRALERDPDKRPASCGEFAEELRALALEHGLLGSRREVADWVTSLVGDLLEQRRELVRTSRRSRTTSVQNGSIHITDGSLPVLPSLTPVSRTSMPAPQPMDTPSIVPAAPAPTGSLWPKVAVLVAFVLAGLLAAILGAQEDEPERADTAGEAVAAPTEAEVAAPRDETGTGEIAADTIATNEAATDEAATDEESAAGEPTDEAGEGQTAQATPTAPTRPRAAPRPPARPRARRPARPAPEPEPEPAPTPAPRRRAAERNPYLLR